jgi:hypothetical protein
LQKSGQGRLRKPGGSVLAVRSRSQPLKTENFEHPDFRLCWFKTRLNLSDWNIHLSPLHCSSKLQAFLCALAFATQLAIATSTGI